MIDQKFFEAIRKLKDEYGSEFLFDAKKCASVLADSSGGEFKKEGRLLVQAVEAGVAKTLNDAQVMSKCRTAQIKLLRNDYFMAKPTAVAIVDALIGILKGSTPPTSKKPRLRTMLFVGIPVLAALVVGLVWFATPKVQEVEIYENGKIVKYTFSNDLKSLEKIINKQVERKAELDKVEWELNEYISTDIKNAMNKYDVNYAMMKYTKSVWYRYIIFTIYKRIEDKWFSWKYAYQTSSIEAETHYGRGRNYSVDNDYVNGIYEYTKAIKLDSKFLEAYIERGVAYQKNNQYDLALADFTEVIRLDPDYIVGYIARAELYASPVKEQYVLAIDDFSAAIRLFQGFNLYEQRGDAYRALKQYDKAIADYDKSIELNPKAGWLYSKRGDAYAEQGKNKQAIADYTEAVRLSPDGDIKDFAKSKLRRLRGW